MVKNMIIYSCSGKPIFEGCHVKIQDREVFLSFIGKYIVNYPRDMDSDLRFARKGKYRITKIEKVSDSADGEYFLDLDNNERMFGINDYWYISNFMVEPVIDEKYIEFIKNLKENDIIWAINSL